MRKGLRFGLLAIASACASAATARDEPLPAVPCPVEGILRVAGAGSLTGVSMLDACAGHIVIAPAAPAEYLEPRNTRISPENRARVMPIVDMARNDVVVRIAPKQDEPLPAGYVTGDGAVGSDTILAMRPISYRTPYDDMIGRVAQRHRIDPLLLHAVISQESRYHERATSPVGARGLMQLMPATARMLGVGTIAHPESNVDGGARLLRRLYTRYNDFPLVLAAYNAGEGAVAKYGNQIPPYAETRNYVQKVLANYQRLVSEQNLGSR